MEILSEVLLKKIEDSKPITLEEDSESELNEATIGFNVKRKSKLTIDDLKSDILNRDNNMIPFVKARRKRVIVITPFLSEKLDIRSKLERYANLAMLDSIQQNEAPIASQSFYVNLSGFSGTNIERDISYIIQFNWLLKAELVAFYVDFDITPAMESMLNYCLRKNIRTEIRSIGAI